MCVDRAPAVGLSSVHHIMDTHAHACTHTHIHAHIRTRTYTHTRRHMHSHAHTLTDVRTHVHTHIRSRTHTRFHINIQARRGLWDDGDNKGTQRLVLRVKITSISTKPAIHFVYLLSYLFIRIMVLNNTQRKWTSLWLISHVISYYCISVWTVKWGQGPISR